MAAYGVISSLGLDTSQQSPGADSVADVMECDLDTRTNLHDQLKNIQNMIRVTKENVDFLIAKFAGLEDPPSLYLHEYRELTGKLHDFESKEQELMEKLSLCSLSDGERDSQPSLNLTNQALNEVMQEDGSPRLPRSPLKSFIRAHLPDKQRTSVQVKPGQTLRDALQKAMERRQLTPEQCDVWRCSKPKRCAAHVPPLCTEVRISPPNADLTRHQTEYFKRLLAGAGPDSAAGVLHTSYRPGGLVGPWGTGYHGPIFVASPQPMPRTQPPPMGVRERSTSAPNVSYNSVNPNEASFEELSRAMARSHPHSPGES
ncbi:unnamed protein product [Darwinula stevensoni]|uniref:RBD domain-containing protein n=1 Tax=Darwinula stevensoni TaxID=69355 RepID=A0A7R8X249_9CRUS|nr:unnamed protein product [Darwinula stevensoni]CAG0882912.1 unnamed protein product [Darwinula stevensoni]